MPLRSTWIRGLVVLVGVTLALGVRAPIVVGAPTFQIEPPLSRDAPAGPPKLAEALRAYKAGDHQKALTLSRELVKEQPGSADGHELRGAAAMAKGEMKEAEQAFAETLRIDPKRARAVGYQA